MRAAPSPWTPKTPATAALLAAFLVAFAWAPPAAAIPPEDRGGVGERDARVRPRTFTLELVLATGPTFRNGVGVAIAFDGQQLEFQGFDGLEAKGLLGSSRVAERDDLDVDGDERSNSLVRLAWLLPGGGWETPGKEVVLGRAIFRQSDPEPPRGQAEAPAVAVVSLSADRKGWFPDQRVALNRAAQGVRIAEEGALVPARAEVLGGTAAAAISQVSGDSGSRPFVLGRFQSHRPLELESARMATGTILPCNLDVDGNNVRDALTDGLLLHRYLFGFTGSALVSGGLGTGATRSDGAAIAAFLAQSDCGPMLDVDGNQASDALTDGLLAVRYLFGFSGDGLVAGAIGTGATRTAAEDVARFLEYRDNPREVAIQATLAPGESARDVWGDIHVKAVDSATSFTVVAGMTDAGDRTVEVTPNPIVAFELTLPDASDPAPAARAVQGTARSLDSLVATSSTYNAWGADTKKWFGGTYGNRLPESKQRGAVTVPACLPSGMFWAQRKAAGVRSLCAETEPATPCYTGKEPVLFIHGYKLFGGAGDGASTFGRFPDLVKSLPAGYAPFLFEWSTDGRFEDAAVDLGAAIRLVAARTGKKVHLVGHSMGGVLARVLLQGLAATDQSDARDLVQTLTTLGTPHSGIAPSQGCFNGVVLPDGQDSPLFASCKQLSCHELGQAYLSGTCEPAFFAVAAQVGGLAALLSSPTYSFPSLPVLVLLGWTIENVPNVFAKGDELISYRGQRFLPSSTTGGSCASPQDKTPDPLLNGTRPFGGAAVTEKGLHDTNPVPGAGTGYGCITTPYPWFGCTYWERGYRHVEAPPASVRQAVLSEAYVDCAADAGCNHDGYTETKAWISLYPAGSSGMTTYQVTVTAQSGVDGSALSGVRVIVSDASGFGLAEALTDAGGAAVLTVPFRASASYQAQLSKAADIWGNGGYQTVAIPFQTVAAPAPKTLGPVYMWPQGLGALGGRVTSSTTGSGIAGVACTIRRLGSIDVFTPTTDSSGNYLVPDLASARYQALFSKSGYEVLQTEFVVTAGPPPTNGDVSLTPTGGGGDEITVNLPNLPAGAKPLVLVRVPEFTFNMGAPETELGSYSDERPIHQVMLSEYYIGKYEVTQAQWQAVMGTPMPTSCGIYGLGNDYPVYCVSRNDIVGPGGFAEKLWTLTGDTRFRLPTEAEWERAARAGTPTRFSFGDALDSDDDCGSSAEANPYVWWCANASPVGSKPVGTKLPNQLGAFDMHGNVAEWVQDWYGAYTATATTDPTGRPDGYYRQYRGGGALGGLQSARSANRTGSHGNGCGPSLGFRIVRAHADAPRITDFAASRSSVLLGQSSVLSWGSTGGATASIAYGIGSVDTIGTRTVAPSQTTTYTLTVTGVGGTATKQLLITVSDWSGEEISVNLPDLPAGARPLVLVRVPAFTYDMGAPEMEKGGGFDERPMHPVTLSDYYIGKYEVTQAQWQAVMGTPMPSSCGINGLGNDYPVYCVSWNDVAGTGGFIEKLRAMTGDTRFQLPTEAEWERAARAGTQTRFPFGDALDSDDSCGASAAADPYAWWCGNNSPYGSKPVGMKLPNQLGLFDMHGNVGEWVRDWYGAYSWGARTNPTGPSTGSLRDIRGGSWDAGLYWARSAHRGGSYPDSSMGHTGFRLARSL